MTDRVQKVKIIATVGPASSDVNVLKKLVLAGVNLFRLNFSHGSHDFHAGNVQNIRAVERELGTTLGIIADLQGPKLRVGAFQSQEGIDLIEGKKFILDTQPAAGDVTRVQFPHVNIYKALRAGQNLLLVDGKIKLRIEAVDATTITTRVICGGRLSSHQGVNIPDTPLPLSALTDKDREDVAFIKSQDVDFIALSFVQRPDDIMELRTLIQDRLGIIAKIEKPQALDHLEEIVRLSQGIMVARGDLGVECPPEMVPALQRRIIAVARRKGRPVIVATQMLESMIENPSPTRAEASDVATAVYEGADSVMLSGESAVGKYPVLAVEMMHKIIVSTTQDVGVKDSNGHPRDDASDRAIADAMASAANQIVQTIGGRLIVTFTATGLTALRAAHKRPRCPILAMTPSQQTARRLTLVWGVLPRVVEVVQGTDHLLAVALQQAKKLSFVALRDKIVITFGVPFNKAGTTNTLHVDELR